MLKAMRIAVWAGVLVVGSTAYAQRAGQIPTPPALPMPVPVEQSQSGGAITARRPGRLVQAGLQRASDFSGLALNGGPDVVDPPHSSIKQQALAQSIQIIFQNLNLFLVGINNMIRANAGLPFQAPRQPSASVTNSDNTNNPLGALGELFDSGILSNLTGGGS
ncbi:MAG TPA: hypothetical protein VGM03_14690 [Phycisphaerae bacterium]|jgi:hypothetical protein